MADMTITNQTNNPYTFGPYQLVAGVGQTVTIDTTTNASLYLTQDSFADIVNSLYVLGYVTVTNPPTPFPRATGVPQLLHGDGSPEGVVFATQGSAFMRRDNSGAGNALYAKTTGPSQNTGWQAFSGSTAPAPATTLPGSPSNGQQAVLVDSTSAPTYAWLLQYSTAASKWIFLGGSPLATRVSTDETTTSTSYTDLTTVISVTLPRAGAYLITHGADIQGLTAGNGLNVSVKKGANATADSDGFNGSPPGANGKFGGSFQTIYSGAAASDVVKQQYKSPGGTSMHAADRWLSVIPVTLS